jgi:hypothetical protein
LQHCRYLWQIKGLTNFENRLYSALSQTFKYWIKTACISSNTATFCENNLIVKRYLTLRSLCIFSKYRSSTVQQYKWMDWNKSCTFYFQFCLFAFLWIPFIFISLFCHQISLFAIWHDKNMHIFLLRKIQKIKNEYSFSLLSCYV